jgi:cytochrome c oxidase subunit 3/cytochrome c oxidase subunit I+III
VTDLVVPARWPRAASPNGWWGMVVFVTSEATLFGVLVGSYIYLRFHAAAWPPHGIPEPKVVLPLVLALVLAATTVPMALASSAARRGLARRTALLVLVALVVQSVYFAVAIHEFAHDLDRFTPQRDAYASIYYTLLGADHTHVALGLLLSAWLLLRLSTGLTRYRVVAVRAIAFYWYAVAALTLVVTVCVISPSL